MYLARAIVNVNANRSAYTTILNTNNHKIKIDHIKLFLEPFDHNFATILSLNESNTSSNNTNDRISILKENLRLDHLNSEEKSSVLNTWIEFNDIFFLPNDVLTSTNVLKHEINVTDPTPITSKIYRFRKSTKTRLINKSIKC